MLSEKRGLRSRARAQLTSQAQQQKLGESQFFSLQTTSNESKLLMPSSFPNNIYTLLIHSREEDGRGRAREIFLLVKLVIGRKSQSMHQKMR